MFRYRFCAQRERSRSPAQRRLDYDADNNVQSDEMLPTDVNLSLDAGLAVDEMTSVPIRKNDDEDAWFSLLSSDDPCADYDNIYMLIEQGGVHGNQSNEPDDDAALLDDVFLDVLEEPRVERDHRQSAMVPDVNVDSKLFTPTEIDHKKCLGRTWGGGRGAQCGNAPLSSERYCPMHKKKLAHGDETNPRTPKGALKKFMNEHGKRVRGV